MTGIGRITVEIYPGASSRKGWQATRVDLRCDAIALESDKLMLASVVGPESSIKALAASLHSDRYVQYSVHFDKPEFNR